MSGATRDLCAGSEGSPRNTPRRISNPQTATRKVHVHALASAKLPWQVWRTASSGQTCHNLRSAAIRLQKRTLA
eukprot:scaffold245763_cov31-Tisochrysis_lutea.AAC.4